LTIGAPARENAGMLSRFSAIKLARTLAPLLLLAKVALIVLVLAAVVMYLTREETKAR
jgi:hypothetical protein